jgi:succinate-acetate transporter protein
VNKTNAGSLGLFAYGMSTVLLSFSNVGSYPSGGAILSMALFWGGMAQVIVGLVESAKGNTFGFTAFCGYGFLWITFGLINIGAGNGWWKVSSKEIGMYLFLWAVLSFFLMMSSTKAPSLLTIILLLTVILLLLLGWANYHGASSGFIKIAGWEGVLTGGLALYLGFASLIGETVGSNLPVGQPIKK